MYEQMDEATDRCWAFNKAGQRCEMIAGHERDHNVVISWGPDECWTPNPTQTRTEVVINETTVEHLVAVPKSSGKCVICSHRMHSRLCGQPTGDGFECDCASGVEE